jgi:hypothetical protein
LYFVQLSVSFVRFVRRFGQFAKLFAITVTLSSQTSAAVIFTSSRLALRWGQRFQMGLAQVFPMAAFPRALAVTFASGHLNTAIHALHRDAADSDPDLSGRGLVAVPTRLPG